MKKFRADVAQLVEHSLGKGEVTGSIPVISSRNLSKADAAQLVEQAPLVRVATARASSQLREKEVTGSGFCFLVPVISPRV